MLVDFRLVGILWGLIRLVLVVTLILAAVLVVGMVVTAAMAVLSGVFWVYDGVTNHAGRV